MKRWPVSDAERKRRREEEAYAAALGDDALERQRTEAVERFPCCGERVEDGHHQICRNRPDDQPPAHIYGQEEMFG